MSKHTTWRIIEKPHGLWCEIRANYGTTNKLIADCVDPKNAQLIAAAPELLEAAKAALHHLAFIGEAPNDVWLYKKLKKAIAKAEGDD